MRKCHNIIAITVFLVLVLLVWTALFTMPAPADTRLSETSVHDLLHSDFSNTIYSSINGWESYPEKLYAPADFISDDIQTQSRTYYEIDYTSVQYATHRTQFRLPPGRA